MVFSDTSGKQGIIEDITGLTNVDINAFPIKDRTRSVNAWFYIVWSIIFESYPGWQFMDDNSSDTTTGVPYADSNLVSGTGLYTLPSEALTVNGVQILNSGGTWETLEPLTHDRFQQYGGDAMFTSDSTPRFYMLQGDVIRLLPTPNYSSVNGLRVRFDAGISSFDYTDTTKTPGFAVPFHRMLSIGPSLEYAGIHKLEKESYLKQLWDDYEARLRKFYLKRWKDRQPAKMTRRLNSIWKLT